MVLILVFGTGSVGAVVESFPHSVQATFGVGLAVLSIWVMVSSYAVKAAMAGEVGYGCQKIESELKDLMALADAPEGPDEREVRDRLMEIEESLDRVTARAGDAGLTNNKRLNEKMADEARQVLENTHS